MDQAEYDMAKQRAELEVCLSDNPEDATSEVLEDAEIDHYDGQNKVEVVNSDGGKAASSDELEIPHDHEISQEDRLLMKAKSTSQATETIQLAFHKCDCVSSPPRLKCKLGHSR